MVERKELAMMAYVVREGRLLSLKPSEWLMLVVGAFPMLLLAV